MKNKPISDRVYVCINCGNPVGELYKEYSPSVLKMSNCDKCHEVADKYIEYDPVIVIIDLVLLNRQAYRHVLYNTSFQVINVIGHFTIYANTSDFLKLSESNHWKLAVILLLVESYYECYKLNETSNSTKMNTRDIHRDLFQGEKSFYITFMKATCEMAATFCTQYLISSFLWSFRPYRHNLKRFTVLSLWKSFILSYFGMFTLILYLIWGTEGIYNPWVIVTSYVFISQVQALSVVCSSTRLEAFITASFGLAMKIFFKFLASSIT